jgi:SAM-dependent methyltransferase
MSARESQLTGRLRLRHLLEVTEAANEEMIEERPRFTALAKNEAAPRVVSAFNLFQTPEPLAAKAAQLIGKFGRTLEPSAGLGRLYRAIRAIDAGCEIVLVDDSPECCGELYRETEKDDSARLIQADFLECNADRLGLFDSIVMNPPFKMGRDIKHIKHARTLLAPGGRLVAICANGPRQNEQLRPLADSWEVLPAGSFKESYTNVSAAIMVIDR